MMLLCEQLCWRHEGDLIAGSNGVECGLCRDECFSRAYIALYEPQHRLWLYHIGCKFFGDAHLCCRGCEWQSGDELLSDLSGRRDRRRLVFTLRVSHALDGKLMCDQLLARQPDLCRVDPPVDGV